jgi:hypothetical protein
VRIKLWVMHWVDYAICTTANYLSQQLYCPFEGYRVTLDHKVLEARNFVLQYLCGILEVWNDGCLQSKAPYLGYCISSRPWGYQQVFVHEFSARSASAVQVRIPLRIFSSPKWRREWNLWGSWIKAISHGISKYWYNNHPSRSKRIYEKLMWAAWFTR